MAFQYFIIFIKLHQRECVFTFPAIFYRACFMVRWNTIKWSPNFKSNLQIIISFTFLTACYKISHNFFLTINNHLVVSLYKQTNILSKYTFELVLKLISVIFLISQKNILIIIIKLRQVCLKSLVRYFYSITLKYTYSNNLDLKMSIPVITVTQSKSKTIILFILELLTSRNVI